MRYSKTNLTEAADVGISNVKSTVTGASVLVDKRTTRAYVAQQDGVSAVEINVDLAANADIDLVALVGLTGIETVTITLRYLTSDVASQTVDVITPVQQNYALARFDGIEADEISITFDVGDSTQFSVGYLFCGALSDEIAIASDAVNYSISSAFPVNLTRAGVPLTSESYLRAEISAATTEITFSTFREMIVEIATTGYASPRLWYFDEDCILTDEAIYGILDTEAQQLLPRFYGKGQESRANATLEITEVF